MQQQNQQRITRQYARKMGQANAERRGMGTFCAGQQHLPFLLAGETKPPFSPHSSVFTQYNKVLGVPDQGNLCYGDLKLFGTRLRGYPEAKNWKDGKTLSCQNYKKNNQKIIIKIVIFLLILASLSSP